MNSPVVIGQVTMGSTGIQLKAAPTDNLPAVVTNGAIVAGMSDADRAAIAARIANTSLFKLTLRDIATLGSESSLALGKALDSFLAEVDGHKQPQLASLVSGIQQSVEKRGFKALKDRIISDELSLGEKMATWLSPEKRRAAYDAAWQATREVVSGQTKDMADEVNKVQMTFLAEIKNTETAAKRMDDLRAVYRQKYGDLAIDAAYITGVVSKAKDEFQTWMASADLSDLNTAAIAGELKDKLAALEDKQLSFETYVASIPAEQLILRQIETAAAGTIQQLLTTVTEDFNSVKTMLLNIHFAMDLRDVQKLGDAKNRLRDTVTDISNQLTTQVVTHAANAPGINRLAQAKNLADTVDCIGNMVSIVNTAEAQREQQFAQVRESLAQSRQKMLSYGQKLRPDLPVKTA